MWFHLFLLSRFAVSVKSAGEDELGGGRLTMSKISFSAIISKLFQSGCTGWD